MSDIGALSHVYSEWNSHLNALNSWLLHLMKMKDGFIGRSDPLIMPDNVRDLLTVVTESLDPLSVRSGSALPQTIKRKLVSQIGDDIDEARRRLQEMIQRTDVSIDDFSNQDLKVLGDITSSLDDEVTSLYNRMRRYR